MTRPLLVALLCTVVACGSEDTSPDPEPVAPYFERGETPVGNVRISITDASRSRTLPLEIWYPADESARADADAGQSLAAFERQAPRDAELADLLAAAPDCVRARTRSAYAAAPAAGDEPWPLVVFSHCHACTRFDVASVAEHLASYGIAVAAPDHEDNTLWDLLEGDIADVGSDFLEVRVADVSFVLDAVIAEDPALPAELRRRFDTSRVGVMGHSFGAATAGVVAGRDPRFRSGLAMAAPLSALGNAPEVEELEAPFLFMVAQEDNSIGSLGNTLIRNEFGRLTTESLLVELKDAGHWSFSDYPGLVDLFAAGCGTGERQTEAGVTFEYLDPALAREISGGIAAAWFADQLLGDPAGTTLIEQGHPSGHVTVETVEP